MEFAELGSSIPKTTEHNILSLVSLVAAVAD